MRRIRIIPVLLIDDGQLVKTFKYSKPKYVGDPINAVKIFNDKGVDELAILDISSSRYSNGPDLDLIHEIASECFMPLCFGGGIRTIDQMKSIFSAGIEKVLLNTAAVENEGLISSAAKIYGSQSIVVSIDIKKSFLGKYQSFVRSGSKKNSMDPISLAKHMENQGAGELVINVIDREGTRKGYDTSIIESISSEVSIPVIASGGASNLEDFRLAVTQGKSSAVAAGTMFVFHGPHNGVLINFPEEAEIESGFYSKIQS